MPVVLRKVAAAKTVFFFDFPHHSSGSAAPKK